MHEYSKVKIQTIGIQEWYLKLGVEDFVCFSESGCPEGGSESGITSTALSWVGIELGMTISEEKQSH